MSDRNTRRRYHATWILFLSGGTVLALIACCIIGYAVEEITMIEIDCVIRERYKNISLRHHLQIFDSTDAKIEIVNTQQSTNPSSKDRADSNHNFPHQQGNRKEIHWNGANRMPLLDELQLQPNFQYKVCDATPQHKTKVLRFLKLMLGYAVLSLICALLICANLRTNAEKRMRQLTNAVVNVSRRAVLCLRCSLLWLLTTTAFGLAVQCWSETEIGTAQTRTNKTAVVTYLVWANLGAQGIEILLAVINAKLQKSKIRQGWPETELARLRRERQIYKQKVTNVPFLLEDSSEVSNASHLLKPTPEKTHCNSSSGIDLTIICNSVSETFITAAELTNWQDCDNETQGNSETFKNGQITKVSKNSVRFKLNVSQTNSV